MKSLAGDPVGCESYSLDHFIYHAYCRTALPTLPSPAAAVQAGTERKRSDWFCQGNDRTATTITVTFVQDCKTVLPMVRVVGLTNGRMEECTTLPVHNVATLAGAKLDKIIGGSLVQTHQMALVQYYTWYETREILHDES